MVELPSGEVTLLFSDMEGSTRLLARLGDRYLDVLTAQREVLRSAWADHGGIELGTEGDSFFVVFTSATDGVSAAVAGQRALSGLPFDEGDRPRVRMGLHSGSPVPHDDGYVGMDVHRGARVASVAHGGQIVVSATTATAIRDGAAGSVGLVDLGSHRLKDIAHLEQLFQVTADGLATDFPPVRSLGTTTRLPSAPTAIVGRDGERAELANLIESDSARLLTLTGSGGSGKTRLGIAVAAQVADSFSGGVFFVSLATVTDEHGMWTTIAEALDLPAEGRLPPGFFEHVAHRHVLLLLDNLEQVTGADAVVAQLLEQGPEVVVVATSRVPLHLRGEHEHPVPPLELPDAADDDSAAVTVSGAVQMFVQQAQLVKPSFDLTAENAAAVVEICRRLDGLPLAIELAAARVKLLSPPALLRRLDQTLDLGSSGVDRPSRQQTIRDTIAWSYDLLAREHQRFFDSLGVFVGGSDLDTIEAISSTRDGAGDIDVVDAVTALQDASLITIRETENGEPWVMLLETIRAFALERLQTTGRLDDTRRRHASYYRDHHLPRWQSERSNSPDSITAYASRQAWRHAHADNLRAALAWALDSDSPPDPDRIDVTLTVTTSAMTVWSAGYLGEGLDWATRAIQAADGTVSEAMVWCLSVAADLGRRLGRFDTALDYAREEVTASTTLGDGYLQASASRVLGVCLLETGQTDAARVELEAAITLARQGDYRRPLLLSLQALAVAEATSGNIERSLSLDREALTLAIQGGQSDMVWTQRQNIACSLRELGQPGEAFDELAAIAPVVIAEQDTENLSNYGEDLACVLSDLGHPAATAHLIGAVEAHRERTGNTRPDWQEADIRDPIDRARAALGDDWRAHHHQGAASSVDDAIRHALATARRPQ